MKMLFLADVYAVRNYGISITNDTYFAMKNGPVLSTMDNIVEQNHEQLSSKQLAYIKEFLIRNSEKNTTLDTIQVARETDSDYLSELDEEAVDAVYEEFGNRNTGELIDLTHTFQAWKKHGETVNQNRRAEMDIADLLRDNDGMLRVADDVLAGSRRIYGTI